MTAADRGTRRGHKAFLGFNGELPEPDTGHYLLGKGYRAYSPVLMIFIQPDSWSPFGWGGFNPYCYCVGDPLNYGDPTGHMPFRPGGFRPMRPMRPRAALPQFNVPRLAMAPQRARGVPGGGRMMEDRSVPDMLSPSGFSASGAVVPDPSASRRVPPLVSPASGASQQAARVTPAQQQVSAPPQPTPDAQRGPRQDGAALVANPPATPGDNRPPVLPSQPVTSQTLQRLMQVLHGQIRRGHRGGVSDARVNQITRRSLLDGIRRLQ